MRAAVYYGRGDLGIEEVVVPAPGEGDLLLRVATVGICGTDAHEYAQGPARFPVETRHPTTGHLGSFIPGHEFSGYVEATGPGVAGFEVGDLVACGAGVSCGACRWCVAGATNLCERYVTIGIDRNGALAEYIVAPAAICMKVSSAISPDVAALAQPMACAVHAVRRGRLASGDSVVVIGSGGIGSFLTYVVASGGNPVTVLDIDPVRRAIATQLGATEVLDPRGAEVGEVLVRHGAPNVIFEASGSRDGLTLALETARPFSRLVAVGMQAAPFEIDLRRLALDEIEVIGTNAHRFASDFPKALELLASRSGGWRVVAPDVVPLDRLVEDGLRPMAEGRSTRIKTLVAPGESIARGSN